MTVKSFEEPNPLASELNQTIARESPHVHEMLSGFGKRIFFPKGILAQAGEAKQKAKRWNATIGIAREAGKPMFLPSVMKQLSPLTPGEALPYAPATGRPELRQAWREALLAKNPSLAGRSFSLPIVTQGVTHSLSLVADLFLDRGDTVLLPDKYWENYDLLFGVRFGARMETFPLFDAKGALDVEGLRQALAARGQTKTLVSFNFPNNPTGYSIRKDEADKVAAALVSAAEAGGRLIVLCDDAYFGLFYEDDVLRESLFARLAGAHQRLLAIKADGPTKEEYVWGLRTGMLTFSTQAAKSDEELYRALEKKVAGAVRSAISNCSNLSQSVVAKAMAEPTFPEECRKKREILAARARKVKQVLAGADFSDVFEAYPFNAGYFMCLRLAKLDADTYRTHLLDRHGVGVIADGAHDIRVAFAGVEEEDIPALFETLALAARELSAS